MTTRSFFRGSVALAGVIAAGLMMSPDTRQLKASDHDDGESNIKSRNTNLTDLYVFREDWQTDNPAHNGNLIMIMNTNPRSLPRQQYFFNTLALYNVHVSRRGSRNDAVTGVEDMRFEFSFGAPVNDQQPVRLQIHRFNNGQAVSTETFTNAGTTTACPSPLNGSPTPVTNTVATSGGTVTFFAGLREDPFFFDVDAFFRTRAFLKTGTPGPVARTLLSTTAANSIDFAKGYNVNAIVIRVPISMLQTASQPVFDVWETISMPTGLAQNQ